MTRYIATPEVAKLLRKALKESFPGVKFSVRSRSYAGGSSIDVSYTDGPSAKLVEAVTNRFEGSYFDGMIDYKGAQYHTLDGEKVRLMADFIFVRRDYSDAAKDRGEHSILSRYDGATKATGGIYHAVLDAGFDHDEAIAAERDYVERLSKNSDRLSVSPSTTLARLAMTGDDGYGAGTIGNGNGGELAYKAQQNLLEARHGGCST